MSDTFSLPADPERWLCDDCRKLFDPIELGCVERSPAYSQTGDPEYDWICRDCYAAEQERAVLYGGSARPVMLVGVTMTPEQYQRHEEFKRKCMAEMGTEDEE